MDIKINRTPSATVYYPRHSHRQYEIMYYTDGEGVMWTETGEIPFSRGTIVIMPPNILHGSVSHGGFVNISVECDFDRLLNFDAPVVVLTSDGSEGELLVGMIWKNRYGSKSYLHALCISYVQYLLQMIDIDNETSRCVKKIMLRISEEAFDPEISTAQILRQSGYSEDYARACFKQRTGKTPVEFLTELRIKHACYLIDIYKDSLSLSQIAEKCGYTDYVYFSKRFKEYMGLSPRRYTEGERMKN